RCHRTRRASAQIAPLVLDLRILLRVVLRQALELLARHARHQLAFVVDLEPRDRQRDRALTDTEEVADVDQRMHLAVLTRLPHALYLRLFLLVVLRLALGLLPPHARHQLAFVVDLEPRDRQRDRALADPEEAADVDQRMHLAVLTRLRDAGNLTDLLAFARM